MFLVLNAVLGVDTTEIWRIILIIPTRKHALLFVLVKAIDRSSPNFLAICGESTPHYISPTWTSLLCWFISLQLNKPDESDNPNRHCYCPYSPHESSKLVALKRCWVKNPSRLICEVSQFYWEVNGYY